MGTAREILASNRQSEIKLLIFLFCSRLLANSHLEVLQVLILTSAALGVLTVQRRVQYLILICSNHARLID